jgi:hypothetical protein
MADDVYVVNQALGHLGEPETDDLNPDTMRVSAKKVVRHLEQARDAVLERHGWLCTLNYAELPLSGLAGNWKYSSVFQCPGDFLRVWTVTTPWGPWEGRWEVGSVDVPGEPPAPVKVIYGGGLGPMRISYGRRAPWEALTPSLVDAIGFELAARAARPITGSVEIADELRKLSESKIALALSIEGSQEGGQEPEIYDVFDALRRSS